MKIVIDNTKMHRSLFLAVFVALVFLSENSYSADSTLSAPIQYKAFFEIEYIDPEWNQQKLEYPGVVVPDFYANGSINVEFGKTLTPITGLWSNLTFLFTQTDDQHFNLELTLQKLPKYPDTFVQTFVNESFSGKISKQGNVNLLEFNVQDGDKELSIALRLSEIL